MRSSASLGDHACCPHCESATTESQQRTVTATAMRCPHCRLVIGAGRAVLTGSDPGQGRSRGAAAGLIANAARREGCEAGDGQLVGVALRVTAAARGCDVRRLRMLDYQLEYDHGRGLPSLGVIFATHGSWKRARLAADAAAPPAPQR